MRFLSWLITLPILIFCVVFSVNNRQEVTVDLWPTDYVLSAPLYLVTLGSFLTGFLAGALIFWLVSLHPRWERRRLNAQVARLERELAEAQMKNASPPAPFNE
ncbi:MAG TPA: LapA family protein [Alphaproteobacteria bacterium]|nr:LapA family protein [Alphaproteobacteria bacterium]